MTVGIPEEIIVALQRLIEQSLDESNPVLSRMSAALKTSIYQEAITRALVEQARAEGRSWEEIGDVFGTSATNVKARFGSYRSYEDDEDDDEPQAPAVEVDAVDGGASPSA